MNILFVHEVDWLGKVVFDVHSLAEGLSLLGHRVYAVDYESMWKPHERPIISKGKVKYGVSRAIKGSSVCLISPPFVKIPVLSRVSAFFAYWYLIGKVIKRCKIDCIVLYAVPTSGLQTIFWAKLFGVPVVFRAIDVLSELVSYQFLRPIIRIMERTIYSQVDAILALTNKLREYVVSMRAKPDKAELLPMVIDDIFIPTNADVLRKKLGFAKDDKIILFIGTLFAFSGLDMFIPQFSSYVKNNPKLKLLIVGDGIQRRKLEALAKEYNLVNNVVILGFQPYSDMPQYIGMADVCLLSFMKCKATDAVFPGKLVQYLACGKPVVMQPLDGVRSVIAGENQGVVYVFNPDEMAKEVLSLLESPKCHLIGQAGIAYAKQNHDIKLVIKRLEDKLKDLVYGER